MFQETKQLQTTQDWLEEIADSFVNLPVAPLLPNVNIGLFTNAEFLPSPSMTLAEVTEATFPGYALFSAATWSGVVLDLNDNAGWMVTNLFLCSADIDPGETVLGYYLTNTADDTLIAAEKFTDPVPIAKNGDFISLTVMIMLSSIFRANQ